MAANTDIAEDISSGLGRRISPTFGYYRQPNGWITVSPNTRLERLKYTEEGWTYLDKYGAFDMTPYTANHPFDGLFMFGGAKEMVAEQIIQTGLYLDPPLVPRCGKHLTQFHRSHTKDCWAGAERVAFPQLASVPREMLGPFHCDFCNRDLPTPEARQQHQSVAHAKPLGNIQLGKSLGDTLGAVLNHASASAPVATAPTGPAAPVSPTAPAASPPGYEAQMKRLAELEAKEAGRLEKRRIKARQYNKKRSTSKAPQRALHKESEGHGPKPVANVSGTDGVLAGARQGDVRGN